LPLLELSHQQAIQLLGLGRRQAVEPLLRKPTLYDTMDSLGNAI